MALDQATFAPALKQHYSDHAIENLVYKNNALFALIEKYEKFGGENWKVPLIYGNPQGRSATFSNAQANQTSSQLKAFLLTRVQDYATASIANETIKASEGNADAFLRAATVEIDGALHALGRSIASSLYRNGSGSIGRLISTQVLNATTATLANVEDIVNFEVGMKIVFSAADGGGSVKAGSGFVVGIDRDLGQLQLSATIGGAATALDTIVPTIAVSDYVFVEGDYDKKLKGLDAWLVGSAVTSASFFGVDRTSDKTRLAGVVQDGTAKPIEEALIDLKSRIHREGGNPDYCFMSYKQYANLEKALGTKVQYVDVKAGYEAAISFRGIALNSPSGVITCMPDLNNSSNFAYMLQLDTWTLASLGKAPSLFDTDGLRMLRNTTSDSLEIRCFSYHNVACRAPGFNGKVLLSA